MLLLIFYLRLFKLRGFYLGTFDGIFQDFSEMIPDKASFLKNFTQRFKSSSPDVNILEQNQYWEVFIPNEHSGPCYMYTPPFDSDPGDTNNMYIVFNFSSWDPLLEIFLHEKKDFFYSKKKMINSKLITFNMLNQIETKYPRALGKQTFILECF